MQSKKSKKQWNLYIPNQPASQMTSFDTTAAGQEPNVKVAMQNLPNHYAAPSSVPPPLRVLNRPVPHPNHNLCPKLLIAIQAKTYLLSKSNIQQEEVTVSSTKELVCIMPFYGQKLPFKSSPLFL